jgi:hypothetical protein
MSGREHACYIGVKRCGCVVAAVVDDPDDAAEVGADLNRLVRDGYTIERVSLPEARARLKRCRCGEPCLCGHPADHHADDGCWEAGCDCRQPPAS